MIYVVANQHPTLPEVSMFATENKADADQYRAIGWTVLEIEAPPSETETTRFVDRSWAQFCAGIGDSDEAGADTNHPASFEGVQAGDVHHFSNVA